MARHSRLHETDGFERDIRRAVERWEIDRSSGLPAGVLADFILTCVQSMVAATINGQCRVPETIASDAAGAADAAVRRAGEILSARILRDMECK